MKVRTFLYTLGIFTNVSCGMYIYTKYLRYIYDSLYTYILDI